MPNDTPNDTLVQIRGLKFAYGPRVVLDGVDLDIKRGRVTAIIGPTACGKSTLLKLIGAQYVPDAGTVHFDGIDVHQLKRKDLYELRERMGMMFQAQALLTDLSVFDNVAFPLREHTNLPESMIRDIVLVKLQAIGLRGARDLYPDQLSGGMSRRVAMARAIAMDPDLAMYDEPFAGLDPISLNVIAGLIRTLNDALGATSIVVTYDVHESLKVADYLYVISEGVVIGAGAPAEMRESKDPRIHQFLNMEPDGPVRFHYPAPPLAGELSL
jgi:phospholipid/cholesterol/gamma-HCH transport system ATP-binding protein